MPMTIEGHFSVLSHRFTYSQSETSCYSAISYNYPKERTLQFLRVTKTQRKFDILELYN